MNRVILIGRMVRDPELKVTQTGMSVANFTLAVDRRFKNKNGERQTDFIPCVVWNQQADFVHRYFKKGVRVAVMGSMQVRSWDSPEGRKIYVTEVIVEEVYFADGKGSDSYQGGYQAPYQAEKTAVPDIADNISGGDDFFPTPDDDTSLPFDL